MIRAWSFRLVLAALMIGFTGQADAAPPKGEDCFLRSTGPLMRAELIKIFEDKPAENADQKKMRDDISYALADCKRRFGWSAQDFQNVYWLGYAFAILEQHSLDLEANVDAWNKIDQVDAFAEDMFQLKLEKGDDATIENALEKHGLSELSDDEFSVYLPYVSARVQQLAAQHSFRNRWTEQQIKAAGF